MSQNVCKSNIEFILYWPPIDGHGDYHSVFYIASETLLEKTHFSSTRRFQLEISSWLLEENCVFFILSELRILA